MDEHRRLSKTPPPPRATQASRRFSTKAISPSVDGSFFRIIRSEGGKLKAGATKSPFAPSYTPVRRANPEANTTTVSRPKPRPVSYQSPYSQARLETHHDEEHVHLHSNHSSNHTSESSDTKKPLKIPFSRIQARMGCEACERARNAARKAAPAKREPFQKPTVKTVNYLDEAFREAEVVGLRKWKSNPHLAKREREWGRPSKYITPTKKEIPLSQTPIPKDSTDRVFRERTSSPLPSYLSPDRFSHLKPRVPSHIVPKHRISSSQSVCSDSQPDSPVESVSSVQTTPEKSSFRKTKKAVSRRVSFHNDAISRINSRKPKNGSKLHEYTEQDNVGRIVLRGGMAHKAENTSSSDDAEEHGHVNDHEWEDEHSHCCDEHSQEYPDDHEIEHEHEDLAHDHEYHDEHEGYEEDDNHEHVEYNEDHVNDHYELEVHPDEHQYSEEGHADAHENVEDLKADEQDEAKDEHSSQHRELIEENAGIQVELVRNDSDDTIVADEVVSEKHQEDKILDQVEETEILQEANTALSEKIANSKISADDKILEEKTIETEISAVEPSEDMVELSVSESPSFVNNVQDVVEIQKVESSVKLELNSAEPRITEETNFSESGDVEEEKMKVLESEVVEIVEQMDDVQISETVTVIENTDTIVIHEEVNADPSGTSFEGDSIAENIHPEYTVTIEEARDIMPAEFDKSWRSTHRQSQVWESDRMSVYSDLDSFAFGSEYGDEETERSFLLGGNELPIWRRGRRGGPTRRRRVIDMKDLTGLEKLISQKLEELIELHGKLQVMDSGTKIIKANYINTAREIVKLGKGISTAWKPVARACSDPVLSSHLLTSLVKMETLAAQMRAVTSMKSSDERDRDTDGVVVSSARNVVETTKGALSDLEAAKMRLDEEEGKQNEALEALVGNQSAN